MKLVDEIVAQHSLLTDMRQRIHSYPEIAFEETKTSALVGQCLREWGLEVHDGIGGTGVVARIEGKTPGPTIALRADMDALPMTENTRGLSYRSVHSNCAHACGHDGHTTMLLGAAQYLAKHPPATGSVIFIFQPAEETGEGAQRMLHDGLLERFPFDEIYACHNMPLLGKGKAGLRGGATLSSYVDFDIDIEGQGGHVGAQHLTRDPLQVAARLVSELSSFTGRYVGAGEAATLGVGVLQAGDARNIIPECANLQGTLRTLSKSVQEDMVKRIKNLCHGYEAAYGCRVKFSVLGLGIPCVNSGATNDVVSAACTKVLGAGNVDTDIDPYPFSDDFAFFQERVPGSYFFLGQDGVMVHEPEYDFDDDLLPIGASIFVQIVRIRCG